MARFGLLLLNKGIWDGTDILKDSNYFRAMTTSSQSINNSYGYLTWLNGKSSYMLPGLQNVFNGLLCPDAPIDMYAALGKNGQIINVIPSQNIVMIRMGDMWTSSNVPNDFNNDIWKRLKQVICGTNASVGISNMDFGMYPNPCSNVLNLNTEHAFSNFQIMNLYGQKVMKGKTSTEIDVQALNPGIFFIELHDDQRSLVKRMRFEKRGD
jgi:hypothetical protein